MSGETRHIDPIIGSRGQPQRWPLGAKFRKARNSKSSVDRENEPIVLWERAKRSKPRHVRSGTNALPFEYSASKARRDEKCDVYFALKHGFDCIRPATPVPGRELGTGRRPAPQLGGDPPADAVQVRDAPVTHHMKRDGAFDPHARLRAFSCGLRSESCHWFAVIPSERMSGGIVLYSMRQSFSNSSGELPVSRVAISLK